MTNETNEVIISDKKVPSSVQLPIGSEAQTIIKWAEMMSETKYYQTMIANGGKNAIVALFLAARELDIPPIQALNGGLYIVQGRVSLSAQMMNMMIRRKGHSINQIVGTDKCCKLVGKRADNGDSMDSEFTIDQANQAGLTKNPVWKSFPQRMLFNRALSNLAKNLFPDCIGNAVIEGEMESVEVIDIKSENEEKNKALEDFKKTLNPKKMDYLMELSSAMNQNVEELIIQGSKNPIKFEQSFKDFTELKKEK